VAKLSKKWSWGRLLPGSWRLVATVDAADEVPLRLPRRGFVLVGSRQRPRWLAFDCPCRARHRVLATLDSAHSPHWNLGRTRKLTVWPSFDCRGPAGRCHYFIRDGRVLWISEKAWAK